MVYLIVTKWVGDGFKAKLFSLFEICHPFGNKNCYKNWKQLGSVWIGLILLKLKIYCWNHCSKIIFKYVNSAVGPIFNEKIDKKMKFVGLWTVHGCTVHGKLVKSWCYCSCTVHKQ